MRFRLREGDTPLISRLPARLVAITCLLLVGMVITLAWTRESGNSRARDAEEARLRAAIENKLNGLVLEAVDGPLVAASLNSRATDIPHNEAGLEVIDLDRPQSIAPENPTAGALAEKLAGEFPAAREAIASGLRGAFDDGFSQVLRVYPRKAVHGIVSLKDTFYAFALVPAYNEGGDVRHPVVLLRYEAANTHFLARLSTRAQVGYVGLRSGEPEVNENGFRYASAGEPVLVAWRADRPGDRLNSQLSASLISIMALYTGLVAFFMTRKLAESEMDKAQLAAQDILTGLANRLLFTIHIEDEIARTRRNGGDFALLYLDFDRFKEVNDTFGHDGGDLLIISAARRIESVIRQGDRLARFGGDEFALLQADVHSLHDCELLAERIIDIMRQPFEIHEQKVNIGVSIGITLSTHGRDERGELMRRADLALYRAKNHGRGHYVFFDDAMNSELQRQKRIEDELRYAIAHDELDVSYQPVVAAGTHKLAGVEALVRWNHPERGVINPSEFIAIAEERGLINDLGIWVLRRACSDAVQWPGIKLAVNVSAMQFRHKDFLPSIRRTLAQTGFDPARLELELTESVVVADAEQAEAAIIELRSMGIRLALDDFGTGYSSLIYLRRFAIDKIKIDRSFVDMMEGSNENMEIVRNVTDLGRRLGLTVTAEGVETPEQIALLEEFGCNELQGYYFGKPLSCLKIPGLIAAGKVGPDAERRKTPAHAA